MKLDEMMNHEATIDHDKAMSMGIVPCKVFCDGKEIIECTRFNQVQGWASSWVVDDNGKPELDCRGLLTEQWHKGDITYEKIDAEH